MSKQISHYRTFEHLEGEILRVFKLDIRIGEIVVTDQFEWDINNPENKPEEFAINLCADLGLDSEFILPIAHSIKIQILENQKVSIQVSYQYKCFSNKNSSQLYPYLQLIVNLLYYFYSYLCYIAFDNKSFFHSENSILNY